MPRAAIIIQFSQVALIERHRVGLHYFLFPGGKIEESETPLGAGGREVREELGLGGLEAENLADVIEKGVGAVVRSIHRCSSLGRCLPCVSGVRLV